jgi:hypothetical protein
MPIIGKCKLCLAEGVELQDSHFLSKGIYKALRIDVGQANPNPYVLSPEGVVQTSKQRKAHLLCRRCELLLSQNGEDWMMRNGLKNTGKFVLASLLAKSPFSLDASRTARVYQAATILGINIKALTYFPASLFWRGSIHPWKTDNTRPVPLGPYEEPLRQYLLGQADFPTDMILTVTVRSPSDISHFTHEPIAEWHDLLLVGKFPMPGFAFGITAGIGIPQGLRNTCFVRGDGNPIFVTDALESHILSEGVKMLERINYKTS